MEKSNRFCSNHLIGVPSSRIYWKYPIKLLRLPPDFRFCLIFPIRTSCQNQISATTSWLLKRRRGGLQNSGILCSYYPETSMFIPISGIFCTYFPVNGPERAHFLEIREHNDINFLYLPQMDRDRRNNDIFCPYFFALELLRQPGVYQECHPRLIFDFKSISGPPCARLLIWILRIR